MSIQNAKKGDSVILCGFTGIKLGVFTITSATKKTVTLTKANGDELVFDRKTCKQINVEEGKEKYANKIIEDDGSYVAPSRSGGKKTSKKATSKKQPAPAAADDEDEDEEEDEEEAPKPKKPSKKAAPVKKPSKKAAPVVEDDEDDDDDDFEEIDD